MIVDAAADHDPALRDRVGCELVAEDLWAGSETRIRVTGTSMLPAVWPGDVLRVRASAETSPSKGSVVLFLRNGRLFAHRVVGRYGGQLITRGDAVPDCDAPVAVADVLGIVAGLIREGEIERPLPPPSLVKRMAAFCDPALEPGLSAGAEGSSVEAPLRVGIQNHRLEAHATGPKGITRYRGSSVLGCGS